MKLHLHRRLWPPLLAFLLIALSWIVRAVPFTRFLSLFLGFLIGSFILDTDHFLYWLVINPSLDDSRQIKEAISQKKISTVIKIFRSSSGHQTSLIFHHYFFQTVLCLISIFIFTSSGNSFAMAALIAANLHLLSDETADFVNNPRRLQHWLFAREVKQLSQKSLKYYLLFFYLATALMVLLLSKA